MVWGVSLNSFLFRQWPLLIMIVAEKYHLNNHDLFPAWGQEKKMIGFL